MNAKSHRWQKTAIAAAAVALLSLSASQALALSLGRLTVQSALGEPLRAEIDIPDINAEEAASLKANVAKPAAFVAAGLDYNPAMSSLQTTLERRADGRAFIRLSSDKTINDPFVDIILEATWSSGRIVRDYTMLFDPPSLRQTATAPAPTLAQVSPAVVPAPVVTPTPAPAPSVASAPITPPMSATPAPAPKPVATQAPVASPAFKPAVAMPTAGSSQVVVKAGDTASKIVGRSKPSDVSLDQMLVALLRNNPDAFIKDNINRIRTGAVINLPTADQAQFVSASEATQIVQAQSKDFNEFRRNLATNAPSAAVETASRTATGAVQAKVEDKKPAPTTPDKLTLSKGALQSQANEAKIAKERADKEAKTRADEIAKNIADLKKLEAKAAPEPVAASPAKPTTPPPVQAAPVAPAVPVPTVPVVAAPVAPKASEPAVAEITPPVVAAPPPPAVKPLPVPVAAPAIEEPSLIDDLIANPLVPVGAGGLIALIGGIALYRMRQRKKGAAHVDSSFLESRLQPDSFFGASGGQRIDTANESVGGSSMVYSASQLDAADDVDPVAEADVYLAYGRDLQAEEILKEAARTTPGRLAIHVKLLEIFAKRRDTKSFETTANQAFRLAGSNSPDWARISEMGLSIDPTNPLYKPGGSPSDSAESAAPDSVSSFSSTVARAPEPELPPTAKSVDLDLDLDFSLDDEPASAISDVTGASVPQARYDETIKLDRPAAASAPQAKYAETVKLDKPASDNSMEMDFDLSDAAPLSATPEISLSMDGVSLTEPEPSPQFDTTGTMPIQPSAAPAPGADSGMLEFDLGSLSLDLDGPSTQGGQIPTDGPSAENDDPLGTKLALAEEFVSIGDEDGARALIEEVVAEATGDMRAKAQKALASLS